MWPSEEQTYKTKVIKNIENLEMKFIVHYCPVAAAEQEVTDLFRPLVLQELLGGPIEGPDILSSFHPDPSLCLK